MLLPYMINSLQKKIKEFRDYCRLCTSRIATRTSAHREGVLIGVRAFVVVETSGFGRFAMPSLVA